MWKWEGISSKPTHRRRSRTCSGTKTRTAHDTGWTESQRGGQGFQMHVPQRDFKVCNCSRGTTKSVIAREVLPNIFPATDCEVSCNVHSPLHFHSAFTGHLSLSAGVFESPIFRFLALRCVK